MAKKTTKKKSSRTKAASKKTARKASAKKVTKKASSRKATRSSSATKAAKSTKKAKTAKKATKAKVTRKTTAKVTKVTKKSTTSKKATTRKTASKASAKAPVTRRPTRYQAPIPGDKTPVPVQTTKKIKTTLTRKQLVHYRQLLLEKRAELVGDIAGMEESALRGKDSSNLSTMPLHMADVGSDTYDQDLMIGLMESERTLLQEIVDALGRIEAKTFGMCLMTGAPINKARLEAKPWAKYCIEAARLIERNGGRMPMQNP